MNLKRNANAFGKQLEKMNIFFNGMLNFIETSRMFYAKISKVSAKLSKKLAEPDGTQIFDFNNFNFCVAKMVSKNAFAPKIQSTFLTKTMNFNF